MTIQTEAERSDSAHLPGWARAFEDSAEEVARVALSLEPYEVEAGSGRVPEHYVGSYLALVATGRAYQVGILSDAAGCDALSRALLGMSEEDELSVGDRGDAMCEIVNMLAGGVKRRLPAGDDLKLGLPFYVNGRVEPNGSVDTALLSLRLSAIHAVVVVFTQHAHDGGEREARASAAGAARPCTEDAGSPKF